MRKMAPGKMGNFVPNWPIFLRFFSHFQLISHMFSTFSRMYFWQFLTIPHFPPFPPISPHFALFFHFPHFPEPLRVVG